MPAEKKNGTKQNPDAGKIPTSETKPHSASPDVTPKISTPQTADYLHPRGEVKTTKQAKTDMPSVAPQTGLFSTKEVKTNGTSKSSGIQQSGDHAFAKKDVNTAATKAEHGVPKTIQPAVCNHFSKNEVKTKTEHGVPKTIQPADGLFAKKEVETAQKQTDTAQNIQKPSETKNAPKIEKPYTKTATKIEKPSQQTATKSEAK